MNGCRRASWLVMVALGWTSLVLLFMSCLTGCSRHIAVPASGASSDHGQLPFDHPTDGNGISPTSAFAFESIPARTEITVRLRIPLSSADSRIGSSFEAVVDEPLVQAGKTVLPRGCGVTGRVVAAKASAGPHDPGYLRLTLASIAMNGKSVPLQTSSIFAKGPSYERLDHVSVASRSSNPSEVSVGSPYADTSSRNDPAPSSDDVTFSTGRRLTFRLTQALQLQN